MSNRRMFNCSFAEIYYLIYYMTEFILLFVRKITHADWVIAERPVLA